MSERNKAELQIEEELKNAPPLQTENELSLIERQANYIKNLDYDFRYNEILDIMEFSQNGEKFKQFTEREANVIWMKFQMDDVTWQRREKASVPLIYKLIDTPLLSTDQNPFKDYFEALKWDGKDHIAKLINTLTFNTEMKFKDGTKIDDAYKKLLRRWLVAAVACSLGIQANHVMLLLTGAQGKGKTTWLDRLTPKALEDYRATKHINPDLNNNETANALSELFIFNIDDQLDTIFIKDFNALKSIITAPYIKNRKAYRREATTRPRRANFVGSVNDTNIFRDDQNRRYLTIQIENIEYKHNVDINQVWAQAYHLFAEEKEQFYFNKNEEAIINEINDHYSHITAEQEYFLLCFEPVDDNHPEVSFYTHSEIFSVIKKTSQLPMYERNLSTALKRLKVFPKQKRDPNRPYPAKLYTVRELFYIDNGIHKLPIKKKGARLDNEDANKPKNARHNYEQSEIK